MPHLGHCPECGFELDSDWITPDHDPDAESERYLICRRCGWWERDPKQDWVEVI